MDFNWPINELQKAISSINIIYDSLRHVHDKHEHLKRIWDITRKVRSDILDFEPIHDNPSHAVIDMDTFADVYVECLNIYVGLVRIDPPQHQLDKARHASQALDTAFGNAFHQIIAKIPDNPVIVDGHIRRNLPRHTGHERRYDVSSAFDAQAPPLPPKTHHGAPPLPPKTHHSQQHHSSHEGHHRSPSPEKPVPKQRTKSATGRHIISVTSHDIHTMGDLVHDVYEMLHALKQKSEHRSVEHSENEYAVVDKNRLDPRAIKVIDVVLNEVSRIRTDIHALHDRTQARGDHSVHIDGEHFEQAYKLTGHTVIELRKVTRVPRVIEKEISHAISELDKIHGLMDKYKHHFQSAVTPPPIPERRGRR